jgi:hypothetical protein
MLYTAEKRADHPNSPSGNMTRQKGTIARPFKNICQPEYFEISTRRKRDSNQEKLRREMPTKL